jgi:hypothetical protein
MDSITRQAKYQNPTSETFDGLIMWLILLQDVGDYCRKAGRFLLRSVSYLGDFKGFSVCRVLSLLKSDSLFGFSSASDLADEILLLSTANRAKK